MFDPFQSSSTSTVRRTINREPLQDNTIYYSTASDSDSSGAEHRSIKSSSSRVGKYTPPHRKSGAASPSNDAGVRPGVDTPSAPSPTSPSDAYSPAAPLDSYSDGILPSLITAGVSAPSSPATSATSSTVTSNQSDKQCYVYIRTGHCAKGALCRYKHETSAPPSNTVKHFDPKSHPSYRTKPCYPFIYGQCLKGDECTFKHEIPPQQVLTAMSPASSEPPASAAAVISPEYRTKECKWFSSPGGCWYGDTCKFKHTVSSPTDSPAKPSHQPVSGGVSLSSTPTPTPIAKGDIENLPANHPYFRTRPCPLYLRGACQKGDLCNYLHILPSNQSPSPAMPITPRTPLASTPVFSLANEQANNFLPNVSFVSPFLPRHAQSVPAPATPQRAPHHAFSLPPYSTISPNKSLEIPSTPTMTASTSSSATSSSASASPTSSLIASPPQSFFHRFNDSDVADEETDAILGSGSRFGAIGTGIPSFTKEPMTLVHEIYTYDDDDDDVILYMPSRVSPSPVSH